MARAQGGRVVEGDVYLVYEENYNEQGNRTFVAISDNSPGPVGVVYRRLIYSFDAQGRLSRYESYRHGSARPDDVIVYSYDERGNRVRVEATRSGTSMHAVHEFSYDAEGRVIEGSFSSAADGWKRHRSVSSYEGNLTHSGAVSEAGVQTTRGTVLTDERGVGRVPRRALGGEGPAAVGWDGRRAFAWPPRGVARSRDRGLLLEL